MTPHEYPGTQVVTFEGALAPELCRDAIARFEAVPQKEHGEMLGEVQYHRAIRMRSQVMLITGRPEWRDIDHVLFQSLSAAVAAYTKRFPIPVGPGSRLQDTGYLLVKYPEREGFIDAHADQTEIAPLRVLGCVWYLNDEFTGGETTFRHQGLAVKPRTGMLLVHPAYWTHVHGAGHPYGAPKYVATSFFEVVPSHGDLRQ